MKKRRHSENANLTLVEMCSRQKEGQRRKAENDRNRAIGLPVTKRKVVSRQQRSKIANFLPIFRPKSDYTYPGSRR